ncbi:MULTISPECIES: sigma factor [Pseudofrankia]|uniref:sigma factor n=1 Tax=Pseudofrankia TaxID=2994363 RepID=UPI000234D86F|nr:MULTISPECIES: sigma factor [Pseudofrankia]OHV31740.1 hypothetical protein BCD49_05435 [Pseudofrankia sp. EUN1h]
MSDGGGALAADEFADAAERHRRELRVHCYRLTGSFDEAEDLVQDALVRAWRGRGQLDDPSSLRAWLYRIATNTAWTSCGATSGGRDLARRSARGVCASSASGRPGCRRP